MATRWNDTPSPPIRLTVALAALVHGALLTAGTFRGTYDAYVHIFFADHYANDWFSTWDTRWYTGFTTVSYPPGTHQLTALVSTVVGLEAAFAMVQLTAVMLLIVGVYRTSRLWVTKEAAQWAAALALVSTSIAEAVHVFGQLPTIFSLGCLLNATPFVDRWLRHGRYGALLLAITTLAATTAAHHVTTLFGSVFFLGPIIARILVDQLRTPRAGELEYTRERSLRTAYAMVGRRIRRAAPAIGRTVIFGVLLVATLVVVVLPYWLWSSADPISQVAIPHDSRANFLSNRNAGLVFWVIPWGALLVILPQSLTRALAGRGWPLGLSISLLALLGTGGTTPIPRFLLRGAFDILTLDRFTFWATIAVLPFAGVVVNELVGRIGRSRTGSILAGLAAAVVIAGFVFTANLGQFRTLQPDPIDPEPIAEFMAKDQHERWRYLTLGFGDQMAWVSANTDATTVDGNYHSARRLPELVSRPVERLEGAKFRGMPGIGSLQQFLTTPERYSLKFVFSNDTFYDPLLFANGWHRLGSLRNGIVVWERADITPLPAVLPIRELPTWQRLLWGIAPMTAIVSAAALQIGVAIGGRSATEGELVSAPTTRPVFRRSARSTRRLRLVSGMAGIGLAVAAGIFVSSSTATTAGPSEQVYDYYDDLDFGRLEEAWTKLDPELRPTLEQFLLERSIVDGLLAGYAKLDRLEIMDAHVDGDSAEVVVDAHYVTALNESTTRRTHQLRKTAGVWHLVPDPFDTQIPVEQFVRRTSVDYVDQGRRRVTTEVSDYGDILDRPRIEILDSRLVKSGERWFVVGQLTNVDVDPADVTITSRLLDSDGGELASYQAGQGTVHKVLPGETVPFRVAFEGVVGQGAASESSGVFRPGAVAELTLTDEVAGYDISAKALVTGRDLGRLDLEEVEAVYDGSGTHIVGSVFNATTDTASLPILVMSLLDENGEVLWVEDHSLPQAVRSQRSAPISFELPDRNVVPVIDVSAAEYDNGRTDQTDVEYGGNWAIPLPPESPYTSMRITIVYLSREMAA